jgi:hypothetical protein
MRCVDLQLGAGQDMGDQEHFGGIDSVELNHHPRADQLMQNLALRNGKLSPLLLCHLRPCAHRLT